MSHHVIPLKSYPHLVVLTSLLLALFFLGQDYDKISEDLNEVQEQQDRMHDIIIISSSLFLNDQRCVIDNETADDKECQIQMDLV